MGHVVVTGVSGCIGTWIAKHLLDDGHTVVGLDLAAESPTAKLLGIAGAFPVETLDVTDAAAFRSALERHQPSAVIHLVSLLMPACKAHPEACVAVNVTSFMTVLEAARRQGFHVAYASSAWVQNAPAGTRVGEDLPVDPQSLYGVFKVANEMMAATYARDYGVRANALRPYVVYGPGREVGLTADVNLALLAAARGERYEIGFGGDVMLHHVSDIARLFVRLALEAREPAGIYNVAGSEQSMDHVVAAIERVTGTSGLVTVAGSPLPIAASLDDARLQRVYGPVDYVPLEEGLRRTLATYA